MNTSHPKLVETTQNNALFNHSIQRWRLWLATKNAAALAIALAIATLLVGNPANAISGGATSSKPWVVRVIGLADGEPAWGCSGAALGAELVITSGHCKADTVDFPDGNTVAVVNRRPIAGVDIQLLTLASAHPLNEYAQLGQNFLAEGRSYVPGAIGTVYGYGSTYPSGQRSLKVTLEEQGPMTPWVEVFRVTWAEGTLENGDSGGPLIIDGKLVGIMKAQGRNPYDGHIVAQYHGLSPVQAAIHELQHHREFRDVAIDHTAAPWISAVNVEDGQLYVTMSTVLVNSGKQVVIWLNGKYFAEVQNNRAYYAYKTDIADGSIFRMPGVKDGDLVQIGVVNGVNDPQASELLYERRLNGVQAVTLKDSRVEIRMSTALMHSGKRVIIWLNGAYVGEVFNGSTYYAEVTHFKGGSLLTINHTTTAGASADTAVQIGLVAGLPGMGYGTPANAQLLYDGTLR